MTHVFQAAQESFHQLHFSNNDKLFNLRHVMLYQTSLFFQLFLCQTRALQTESFDNGSPQ